MQGKVIIVTQASPKGEKFTDCSGNNQKVLAESLLVKLHTTYRVVPGSLGLNTEPFFFFGIDPLQFMSVHISINSDSNHFPSYKKNLKIYVLSDSVTSRFKAYSHRVQRLTARKLLLLLDLPLSPQPLLSPWFGVRLLETHPMQALTKYFYL